MGNANDGGMCAATAGRMASGHGTMANDAPAIAQHGEQQQDTHRTVPDLLQHTTLQLVLQHEDEEQEQHEQIADGVEGTPDGTAQQHAGSSSAHGGQQVGDGAAGLYVVLPANLGGPDRQKLTSGAGDTTVAAGENVDAADEAGAEPSGLAKHQLIADVEVAEVVYSAQGRLAAAPEGRRLEDTSPNTNEHTG